MNKGWLTAILFLSVFAGCRPEKTSTAKGEEPLWTAPDSTSIPAGDEGDLIRYGRDLIRYTATYLGPQGTVAPLSNGMNCQNCHLDAGTRPFGNNYGSVASMYPKYRDRSGGLESIEKRVNDCIQRSLNGTPLDSLSNEMRAIVAYMQWLGSDVPKGKPAPGSGLAKLEYLDRAADTVAGKVAYEQTCRVCHGSDGQGLKLAGQSNYTFPPVWGEKSFNTAAGLYRISNMARYIYTNMPNATTYDKPVLKPEEAWDIAAYVVSKPRPRKDFPADWPDIKKKPIDHPFGPYADGKSELEHKYGPFVRGEK